MKQLTERIEQLKKEKNIAGYTGHSCYFSRNAADCPMTHMMISENTAEMRGLVQ